MRKVWISNITLMDAQAGRIGFQSNTRSVVDRKFVFGTIDEESTFTEEGEIALIRTQQVLILTRLQSLSRPKVA